MRKLVGILIVVGIVAAIVYSIYYPWWERFFTP
jgi:hypothetical protein